MLVPEEDIAALEAEVAELLGILEMLPTVGDDGSDGESVVAGIRRYADQVERVGLAAGNAGFLGLRDVCLLFQENLANSDFRQQGLGDAMRERLEEWPILAIGYLGAPSDPQTSESLIDHLRSPAWNMTVSAEEARTLFDVLACGALAPDAMDVVDEKAADVVEEAKATRSSPIPVSVSAEPAPMFEPPLTTVETMAPAPMLQPSLTIETMESPMATSAIAVVPEPITAIVSEAETESVIEAESTALPKLAEAAVAATLAEASAMTAETVAMELAVSAEAFTEQEVTAVREEPASGEAEEPEPADEESESTNEDVAIGEIISGEAEEPELAADEDEEPADEDEKPAGAIAGSSDAGQELLDILCAEIAQIAEDADKVMAVAAAADSASTVRGEALSSYAEHLERLGDASGSIGLTGLQQVCDS